MPNLATRAARRALENATLKLLSIGLAVLLFVFVRGDREEEAGLSIPVVAEPDAARVLVSEPPDRLKVKVRGKSSKLRRVMSEDLEPVRLDLAQLSDGEYFFSGEQMRLPLGVRVVGIQPASTLLRFEPAVTRELEVEAALTGKTDSAFVLTDRRVEPATVRVRGAKSQVLALQRVQTAAIDVGGRWENTVVEVGLKSPGRDIVYDPPIERVRVRLKYEQRVGEKDYDGVAVVIEGSTKFAYSHKPAAVQVRLEGPLKTLRELSPADIAATLDVGPLDDKPPGAHRVKVTVSNLPKGVELRKTRPASVVVTTRPRAAASAPSPEAPAAPEGGQKPNDKDAGQKG